MAPRGGVSDQSLFWLLPFPPAVIYGHARGGIEIDLRRLSQPRHHHVESDGDDRFHDLLRAEVPFGGSEGRLPYANVVDRLATERQQSALGLTERRVRVVAALDGIDLRLRHAETERDRHMLAPFIGAAFPLRGLKDQELAMDMAELLLVQDGIAEPHRWNEIGVGMRQHPEDIQLDRHPVERGADVTAGGFRIDQGQSRHRRLLMLCRRLGCSRMAYMPINWRRVPVKRILVWTARARSALILRIRKNTGREHAHG